jgi:DNA-binding response OmpR family regulator
MLHTIEETKPRVLIVDDEPQIGEFLSEFLSEKGYEVFYAESGEEGLTYIKRVRPHLVLLDVRMSGMGGLETLRIAKEIDPRIGVIMVTSLHEEEVGREALKLGAVDYITKPIDFDYLETSLMYKLSAMFE